MHEVVSRPACRALRVGIAIAVIAGFSAQPLLAQSVPQLAAHPATQSAVSPPVRATVKPAAHAKADSWSQLSDPQRQALAPLESDWESIDATGRKKWLTIARNYPKMSPDAQQRAQLQMREWARTTPEQRRVARDSYSRLKALSPAERAELLEKYQALPDEKKQELAAGNRTHKKLVPHQPTPAETPKHEQSGSGVKAPGP
jgi:hypothetical protein